MAGALTINGSLRAIASCAKIVSILLLTLGSTSAAPSSGSDLWNNPCLSQPARHVRSTAQKELKFFIHTLNKDMFWKLKQLYPKNLKKAKGNCPRLNQLIGPVINASNIIVAHQNFHRSMIEFAVFLDKLKDLPIKTNTQFDLEKRKSIYEDTKNALRLAICEVNETIQSVFKKKPYASNNSSKVVYGCLPKEADLSRIQMLDIQFFKKLKAFIKKGKKALRQRRKNNKSDRKVNTPTWTS